MLLTVVTYMQRFASEINRSPDFSGPGQFGKKNIFDVYRKSGQQLENVLDIETWLNW